MLKRQADRKFTWGFARTLCANHLEPSFSSGWFAQTSWMIRTIVRNRSARIIWKASIPYPSPSTSCSLLTLQLDNAEYAMGTKTHKYYVENICYFTCIIIYSVKFTENNYRPKFAITCEIFRVRVRFRLRLVERLEVGTDNMCSTSIPVIGLL